MGTGYLRTEARQDEPYKGPALGFAPKCPRKGESARVDTAISRARPRCGRRTAATLLRWAGRFASFRRSSRDPRRHY